MKFIASDIDGTLMKANGDSLPRSILEEDQKALKEWTKDNILIVSTGRNKVSTFKLFDYYHLDLKRTFFITSNGAEVFDENRNCIFRQTLPKEVVSESLNIVFDLMEKLPLLMTIYDGNQVIHISEPQECHFENVVNICVESLRKDVEDAKKCIERLNLNQCEVHQNTWYVDIVPENVSKASSIKLIMHDILNDKSPYLIAVGDSYNDVCMFEIADASYTFNNAKDDVKESADYCVDHVYECVEKEQRI